jgi:hypothetical protein
MSDKASPEFEIVQVSDLDMKFEAFMGVLENASLPWYVRTTELYGFIKNYMIEYAGVVSTKLSDPAYEKFLATIDSMAVKLRTATTPYFDSVQGSEILAKLDDLLNSLCSALDNGVCAFRLQLAVILRNLRKAIKEHSAKFAAALKEGCRRAEEMHLQMHQQISTQSLQLWQLIFGFKKLATDTTVQYIEGSKQKIGSVIVGATEVSLQTARPYVQQAVVISKPYVEKAVVVSQPYVEKAYPYVEPLAAKAVDYKTAIEANQNVGPYVSYALGTTEKVVENVKSYCSAELDVSEAVVSQEPELTVVASPIKLEQPEPIAT